MNPDTVSAAPIFSAARKGHALGLVVAGAVFALVALGGSGAIARDFVTAGAFASVAPERTVQLG